MSRLFAELDRRMTPMGEVVLRRRLEPSLQVDVYEVKLGDEYLMSSLFTVSETELARLGLARANGDALDVVVGGLGLGYTARAVLDDPRVRRLDVIEALDAVIDWHHRHLVPLGERLAADPRCHLVHGDFFTRVAAGGQLTCDGHTRVDAVLVDIDHTPRHVLDPSHASFYRPAGLQRMAGYLRPGGVFALWSDDGPDDEFVAVLGDVFDAPRTHVVEFRNPHTGGMSSSTVYTATTAPA